MLFRKMFVINTFIKALWYYEDLLLYLFSLSKRYALLIFSYV